MKKIIYIILSLLLCVGAVGGTVALANHLTDEAENEILIEDSSMEEQGGVDSGVSNNEEESVNNSEDGSDTVQSLVAPANEASLICDGLEMVQGAQLYLGTDTERPAIRFTCNITAELKAEVEADSTKKLAMLLIPTKFFDRVNTDNYTYIDWVNAFNDAGIDSYYLSEFETTQLYENGSNYYMRYRLEEIPYGGVNMPISCLGVLIDNSGDSPTYTYSKLPNGTTYRSNARSVAYVAAATLNANTLGLETLEDAELAKMQGYVNEAVDLANGLETATDDGSVFEISTNTTTKTLSVGETFQVVANYAPSSVLVPIWYRSNDTEVVTVDDNGLITAVGTGTAVVGVYVAGEVVAITITVA